MAVIAILADRATTTITTDRPRPGRRRTKGFNGPLNPFTQTLTFILLIFSLISHSEAGEVDHDSIVKRSPEFRRLAQRGAILTFEAVGLDRRQESESSETASASTATTLSISAADSRSTASSTATLDDADASATTTVITVSTTAQTSPLPSPFDFSLGVNYTSQNCPSFMRDFLANETFKSCLPTSLLLQNSNSFFQASRSPLLLSLTLEKACGVDSSACATLMADLVKKLVQDQNCGQDYRSQQPYVVQAHDGLVAYEPIYKATCVKNGDTGNYCFADAITNATNPSDSYPYYIALGIQLPGGSKPSCSRCLQDTMAVYADAAGNKDQPVTDTYLTAAQLINVNCGPNFVNATLPTGAWGKSGGARASASILWITPFALTVGVSLSL